MGSKRPRILVLGASGQVGRELLRTLAPLGEVVAASLEADCGLRLDLSQPDTLAPLLDQVKPRVLVNAAAYTAVDRAEAEPQVAQLVNGAAVAELGRLAAQQGLALIHYSTDFVYSGDGQRPYREEDPTGPLNVYGASKLAGDQALLGSGAAALIFRTSWVYGTHGHNFLRTMLRLFRERDEVRVVDDQIGSPTWSRLIAEVTAQVLGRVLAGNLDPAQARGVYHLSGGGQTSWHGFARAILDQSGLTCRLVPILTQDYPTPARRPAYSVLDNSKLATDWGLALPDWRQSLAQCLADLA